MNTKEKKIIKIFTITLIVVSFVAFIIFINREKIIRKNKFVSPSIDQNMVVGKPSNIENDLTYQKISVKDDYVVYLCATPKIFNKKLTIYFTSNDKNKDLLKIRILDKDNSTLGESNLIEPNSYIKDIELNRALEDDEQITIKVMSYKKNTYYSNGSFKLNVFVKNYKTD